jgi:site-specific recombinase XerD
MYRDSLGWMLHINGKGDKDRDVPLSQRLSSMLLAYDDGYIFPSQRGSHIGPDRVGKLISKVLGKGTTPHQLRHRFGSDMYIASGYDIRATQEALGHSSVATTQIYTEVPRRKLRAGIDALSAMQDARRIEDNNRRG